MTFSKGTSVILNSFLGTSEPEVDLNCNENYWLLIGKKGKIIDYHASYQDRVLVLFNNNLDDYGLENHNPIKNSLWIKKADLILDIE
ncbi:hypothetical protein [Adhaeribacter terreus]|uniref:Uncharacterized protein n=1 Tax=Adhaeribacter terreus TaxID=529703 RepID=A0ABW0EBD9_9BACT